MGLNRAVLIHQRGKNARDIVFEDQIFLIDAFEQLVTQAVDRFTLLVHHVVIFEQVFAGFKVLGFDGFLGFLDAAGDHARLNGNAFFHA